MARFALLVRCGCGHEFDTGIRIEERNFARATFASNYHTCPRCGVRGTYRKDDYRPRREDSARDRDVADPG
jgi:hypothetical protein